MVVYIDIVIGQAMTISFVHYIYFIKCKTFTLNNNDSFITQKLVIHQYWLTLYFVLCYPFLVLNQKCSTLTIISFPYCIGTLSEYYKINYFSFINKFFVKISFKSKYKHLIFNLENLNYYFLHYH